MSAGRCPVGCPLTPGEYRVVLLVAEGLTNKQIADRLTLAEPTIRHHLGTASQRLGTPNRMQMVLACVKAGWLNLDDVPTLIDEAQRKQQLAQLLADLARAVREQEWLSSTQRRYLEAFDDHLRARTDSEHAATRAQMTQALARVLQQAGITRSRAPARELEAQVR